MKVLTKILLWSSLIFVPCAAGWSAENASLSGPLQKAVDLLAANEPADALLILSALNPSHEERSAYHLASARALVALQRPFESIEHYRLASVFAGTTADKESLLIERADVYAGMGYYSEAAVCYEAFLRQFPGSIFSERAELGIAESRFKNNEFHQALSHYEKAGTSARAAAGRADALQALGRTAKAQELYEELLEHDPRAVIASPRTQYFIGENFRLTGRPNDARIYFESVKDPVFTCRAALGLGLINLEENRFDAAIASFTAAACSPERSVRADAEMGRAEAFLRMQNYASAREALGEIRNKYPYGSQSDSAALILAKLDRKEGKTAEAVSLLKTLIYRRSPVGAALDELEALLLEAKDRDPKAFFALWGTAGRWLLDPSRAGMLVKIAPALRGAGRPFLDVCTWLINYGPEDARAAARLMLAEFYADIGDPSTARSHLERAKTAGQNDQTFRLLAKIHLAAGDARSAAAAVLSMREVGEDDLLLLLDAVRLLKGDEKALAFLDLALQKKKASPSLQVSAADAFYDAGKPRQALAYYRSAVAAETARADEKTAADREWAHYRISLMKKGTEGVASLKAVQAAKSALGRFASAELKGAELSREAGEGRP